MNMTSFVTGLIRQDKVFNNAGAALILILYQINIWKKKMEHGNEFLTLERAFNHMVFMGEQDSIF